MALEVEGGVHLQLDNIYLGCINSEGCLQGPMTMQTPLAPKATPIRIEAEEGILTQSGIGIYDVTAPDEDGGSYIGDVNNGDFVSYSFTAPGIGPYTIDYRVASQGESDGFVMSLDGTPIHSVSIPTQEVGKSGKRYLPSHSNYYKAFIPFRLILWMMVKTLTG